MKYSVCFECGGSAAVNHHVVPRSRGGTKTVQLCEGCHGKAHGRAMTTNALVREAMARKRAAGERIGEVPYGWCLDADGRLVEDADEQEILALIRECRAEGVSLRKIAAVLTGRGVVTKNGKASWSHSTVQSILERMRKQRISMEASDGYIQGTG